MFDDVLPSSSSCGMVTSPSDPAGEAEKGQGGEGGHKHQTQVRGRARGAVELEGGEGVHGEAGGGLHGAAE